MKNMLGGAPSSRYTGTRMSLWIEYELCRFVQDESKLKNPLDVLAHKEYEVPLLYIWLPEYHDVRLW